MTTNTSGSLQQSHHYSDFDDEGEQYKPRDLNLDFEIQQLDKNLKLLENPMTNLTRCKICKCDLKSYMHAKTHYVSIRHKKTFVEARENGVKEILKKAQSIKPSHCKVCNKILPRNILSLKNHFKSGEHKENLESYSLVCDCMTEPAEVLTEHENNSLEPWNKMNDYENEESTPRVPPKKSDEVNHTIMYNVSGSNLSQSIHINRSQQMENFENLSANFVITREVKEKTKVKISLASNNTVINTDRLYCYLCKMEFQSKIVHNVHCFSFPHFEVSKWKSEAVSLGVPYAEYWIHSKSCITCTLCDMEILTPASFKAHNEKTDHRTHLSEWCQAFASWKLGTVIDPKYFYCQLCSVSLMGTTEAENHYNSPQHSELSADKNSHTNLLMSLKPKNKCFDTLNNNMQPESPERFHETRSRSKEANKEAVEANIFEEIEKLMDTLYYSKTVPSDVALEYLKRMNSEITALKQKYEKCD